MLAAALFGTTIVQTLVVDNTDPSIIYWPPDQWHLEVVTGLGYYNNTLMYAIEKGHFASFTFNGVDRREQSLLVTNTVACRY